MPQLDKVTFLSQFFWLCVFYLGFYYIIYKYYLPKISRILALRKTKMTGSQQGIDSLQGENQHCRQQCDQVFSKAFTTSRTSFHDFFSGSQTWLHESLSGLDHTHYQHVNQALVDSLGESSLSQNVLFYHASNPLPEKYKCHLAMERIKTFSSLLQKKTESVLPSKKYKKNQ